MPFARWARLLVLVLFLVACSPAATATLAPPPSPTVLTVAASEVPPTNPPPTATMAVVPATEAVTVAPTLIPSPAQPVTPTPLPSSPTPDPALAAIYSYLEARARADVEAVTALACPGFQGQAATEAVSFRSMQAKLEGVVCAVTGVSGPYTLVGCEGKIITTYGTEAREWDLSTFIYQAVAEEGAWKMCGYN